jgi:hypothetical protein
VLCECGCGEDAGLAKYTMKTRGYMRGQPLRYIRGHMLGKGRKSPAWKSGVSHDKRGYIRILKPDHPHADNHGYVYEHVLVASNVLGKPLPPGTDIHHVNEVKHDNRPDNLVICEDTAYHQLLHSRRRAFLACGYATWRKCIYCNQWDRPERLAKQQGHRVRYHQACQNDHRRQMRRFVGLKGVVMDCNTGNHRYPVCELCGREECCCPHICPWCHGEDGWNCNCLEVFLAVLAIETQRRHVP